MYESLQTQKALSTQQQQLNICSRGLKTATQDSVRMHNRIADRGNERVKAVCRREEINERQAKRLKTIAKDVRRVLRNEGSNDNFLLIYIVLSFFSLIKNSQ